VEAKNVVARASRIGYQAWEAKVQLDSKFRLIGDIEWSQLT